MRKILSIVPAQPGWFSVYKAGEGEGDDIEMPIALWALVDDVEDGEPLGEPYVMALAPMENDRVLYAEIEDNLRGHVFKP